MQRVTFDVQSTFSRIVLQLSAHCPERITHRNIRILVTLQLTMFILSYQLGPRNGHLDVDFINMSLMPPFVWELNNHVAVNHLGAEFFELLRQRPDPPLECRRRLHTSPSDLNR